jgi:hypothetical protein
MKKKLMIILCVILIGISVSGCVVVEVGGPFGTMSDGAGVRGTGAAETFTFDVGQITEIRARMHVNIQHYTSASDVVTLEIQPNLMEFITVEESDGVLTIESTRNIQVGGGAGFADTGPVLTVSSPNLNAVSLSGAGTFTAHDTITSDTFSLTLTGAGRGVADLEVDSLSINMSGAGDMNLTGRADRAEISFSGAGTVSALHLQTREADITMAGAGTVRISASETLRVVAGGVGTIEYRGSPQIDLIRGGLVVLRNVE